MKPFPTYIKNRITSLQEIALPSICHRCAAAIWRTGIPWPILLDPEPLDLNTELQTRLAGRLTYQAHHRGGTHFEPVLRYAYHIQLQDPGTIVLSEHACPRILPPTQLPNYWPAKPRTAIEECPF
jgi:hypothetical protein